MSAGRELRGREKPASKTIKRAEAARQDGAGLFREWKNEENMLLGCIGASVMRLFARRSIRLPG
jgi:hypothetical protein